MKLNVRKVLEVCKSHQHLLMVISPKGDGLVQKTPFSTGDSRRLESIGLDKPKCFAL